MFKTPASAAPLSNKAEIDARYRYWRRHILITIWLGYALFYFTRKSFNAAAPEILASGVMTRTDIGLLATLFYITYGLSKFFSGIVSDRSNARYFMGVGLIATGVVNILFGFSTSLWAFALLWALNAFFQGWDGIDDLHQQEAQRHANSARHVPADDNCRNKQEGFEYVELKADVHARFCHQQGPNRVSHGAQQPHHAQQLQDRDDAVPLIAKHQRQLIGNAIPLSSSKWVPAALIRPSSRFIAGLPIKLATKRLAGFSYTSTGVPICSATPLFITITRWASVIAST